VFFSTFSVVFSEPFYFSALISFNEPFNIYASINLSTLVVQCGALRFCVHFLFYFVFSELVCFSAPICFDEVFYLFAFVNLSVSMVCDLLRFSIVFFSTFMLSLVNFMF
jgi:hypothetical protein